MASKAFGSAKAFRPNSRRGARGRQSFMADAPAWTATADLDAIVADAEKRASFCRCRRRILVSGLPMRKTMGEQRPPMFVDQAFMGQMADIAHAVGEGIEQQGIGLAVHTQSNSALWYERDVDLFMSFTDPRYVWLCPDSL